MASLYKRDRSPYWWIKFRDPDSRKIKYESTRFRVGTGADTRRAQELEATKTLAERKTPLAVTGKWDSWVPGFIQSQVSKRTAERYMTAWRTLRIFLEQFMIHTPREVTYENCARYLHWRETPDARQGKYSAGKNTAILEFKILRWLMREAVKRGYCSGNPAREVVVKRAPRKLFSDYSDTQLQAIAEAINKEREPARTALERCFAVALLHGVRLNETNVNPIKDVNLKEPIPTIQFFQKGGKVRTKPLHPQLIPLFKQLQDQGATQTYALGKWGNRWTKFFVRHGFKKSNPNGCFHSLRVTVENVLREAGIAKEVREAYLSHEHASDVNSQYDRVKIRELLVCHGVLARAWLNL